MRRLEADVFPEVGGRPINEIEPPELLDMLRKVESRGAHETALPIKQLVGQIFRYAIVTSRARRDPSADLVSHRVCADVIWQFVAPAQGAVLVRIDASEPQVEIIRFRATFRDQLECFPQSRVRRQAADQHLRDLRGGAPAVSCAGPTRRSCGRSTGCI